MNCDLCGRHCNVDRRIKNGFCGLPKEPVIAKAGLHFWEEPCISGKSGSGTVFFSGCSLKCVFCQNYNLSHNNFGKKISVERLAEIYKELEEQGANNINLVTPTHFVDAIEKSLEIYRPKIPIVYNTSGFDTAETINRVSKFADIFLIDLKYLSNSKSKKYSKAENYPEIATSAIMECQNHIKKAEFCNDIMQKGIIIRHLLLPSGTKEAIRVIDWIKKNADNCYFSLMSQYTPFGDLSDFPEINRKVTKREYEKVLEYLIDSELQNVYIQDLDSSSEKYIPDFNLSGV